MGRRGFLPGPALPCLGDRPRSREGALESWEIGSLKLEPHFPEVLHSDGDARAIAINLPAGEEMQEHQVHESAYLLVSQGEIEVVQEGRTTPGRPGFLAHFRPGERRHIRSIEDARLLLILAPWPGQGHPSRRD